MSSLQLTAALTSVENGWVQGRILEIPGVITAARRLGEAREGLVDALHEYVASFLEQPDEFAGETEPVRLDIVLAG